jgi:predicted esterase
VTRLCWLAVLAALALSAPELRADVPDAGSGDEPPWCYPGDGIEALTPTLCHFALKQPSDTLVVFLHGLTKVGTSWQHNGERTLVRGAKANGFEVIMPRGRRVAGSKFGSDYFNWPTSAKAQAELESEVLGEWQAAQKTLEERNGKPFAKIYVWGFSAGAYYVSSLALRGRLPVAGYATFAGGGAPKGAARWARGTHPKPPIYVGYGRKDKSRKDPIRLSHELRVMHWPRKVVERKKLGHSMTDAQMREAWKFLEKTKPAK